MTDREILTVYMAQSENVRYLSKVLAGLQKDINLDLKKANDFQVKVKTKILTLIYSAWSEAQFIQIVFTENGFLHSEIVKILARRKKDGIADGWRLMINMALAKVGDPITNKELKIRLAKLITLVKSYIEEPSILRNKIAHGQWVNVLNRENSAINKELSEQMGDLDPIKVAKKIEVHRYLGFIVRDLVQSPKVGFHKHFWTNIVNLENFIEKTKKWSLISKKALLAKKPVKHRAPAE